MSQDVQNAQMKLDGLGSKPVEVSITMTGNEAQIAFRSDESQTRGVLESAGAHLKDMLQNEGLVLAGVSVGTSGTSDAGTGGSSERPPRQGVRQTSIAPVSALTSGQKSGVAAAVAGSGVDLFV